MRCVRKAVPLLPVLLVALANLACAANKAIQIRSEPSGAAVFVDGKQVGVTPLVLTTNDLMPRRAFDGKPSTQAMPVIEKAGYSTYQLLLQEFALPNEVDAELRPHEQGATAPAQALPNDVLRELERLQQLREKGALTEDEFSQLKKELMDRVAAKPPQ